MHYILKDKIPIKVDLMTWAKSFSNTEERRVDDTELNIEESISTVFLGLDHRSPLDGSGDPLLFETMVFGGPLNGEQQRYTSWEEAEQGHKEIVDRIMGMYDRIFIDKKLLPLTKEEYQLIDELEEWQTKDLDRSLTTYHISEEGIFEDFKSFNLNKPINFYTWKDELKDLIEFRAVFKDGELKSISRVKI